ncbi:MAG TPA: SAM-dependent methyltransferase [Streptosporangiaceae bacterium]|nr:SAM-dependent methyltransferase [Streptosporangiaceae bacterium]
MAGAHDRSQHPAGKDDTTTSLITLRADFPNFRIWREITTGRTRYVARRLHPGPGPHTVVTDDLTELRAALGGEGAQAPAGTTPAFDVTRPNIARIYNYIIGGKDHHAADRQAADSILADFPEVAQVARANRDFVTRATHYVATQGITQFIDVGAGLPAEPAVHQTAQRVDPACRVAYVDNDPLVLAYARAVLAAGPGVVVVPGDMRHPAGILATPDLRLLIDLNQPVCILLASVLHFLTPAEADATVAAFRAAMTPGSYLIASAGTSTGTSPALLDRLRSAYAGTSDITGRTSEEIADWFTGLDLVPPGLVDVDAWRPGSPRRWLTPPAARIIGAVGCKPGRSATDTRPPLPRRRPAPRAS